MGIGFSSVLAQSKKKKKKKSSGSGTRGNNPNDPLDTVYGGNQSPQDTYQWWNPLDWFGQHDEPSIWKGDTDGFGDDPISAFFTGGGLLGSVFSAVAPETWQALDLDRGIFESDEEQARETGIRNRLGQSDYGKYLLPAGAAVVGGILGGPQGALAGFSLGQLAESQTPAAQAAQDAIAAGANPNASADSVLGGLGGAGGVGGGGALSDVKYGEGIFDQFDSIKTPELKSGGYNEKQFLGDLNAGKQRFEENRGEIEGLARDQRNAPSVVDEQLKKAYAREQASLANAYAGRSGAGYLENFDQQRGLAHQRLADEGSSLRLQEDLGRQKQLLDTLGQVGQRDLAQTQMLGGLYNQGRGLDLDKYKSDLSHQLGMLGHQRGLGQLANQRYSTDLGHQLGMLGHQRGLADLGLKDKYYGLATDRFNRESPYSGANLFNKGGEILGEMFGDNDSWLRKFLGGRGGGGGQQRPNSGSQPNKFPLLPFEREKQ